MPCAAEDDHSDLAEEKRGERRMGGKRLSRELAQALGL